MSTATQTAASASSVAAPAPDFVAIKSKQRATWGSGDYGFIGTTLQIVGESLCEALDLRAGAKVLDVAAGNGNVSLAAARRWADVTSTDYVGSLLDMGRRRAEADRLAIRFQEADAEALPFPDASFDVVVSSFGVMFTPDHRRSSSEMLRVCRPGGRIGLANWTPSGFIGKLFGVIGRYVPPPAGVTPPSRWGTVEHLQELFGAGATDIRVTPKNFAFRYRSPQHFVDVFRTWYGPVHKAFASLDETRQAQLEQDIVSLIGEFNTSGDETMVVQGEYLEVVVDRK